MVERPIGNWSPERNYAGVLDDIGPGAVVMKGLSYYAIYESTKEDIAVIQNWDQASTEQKVGVAVNLGTNAVSVSYDVYNLYRAGSAGLMRASPLGLVIETPRNLYTIYLFTKEAVLATAEVVTARKVLAQAKFKQHEKDTINAMADEHLWGQLSPIRFLGSWDRRVFLAPAEAVMDRKRLRDCEARLEAAKARVKVISVGFESNEPSGRLGRLNHSPAFQINPVHPEGPVSISEP